MSDSHPIIFVTGRDPLSGIGGGSTYVRSHARAAMRAGYDPHIFCVTDRDETVEAGFGTVHRLKTPFRPRGPLVVPMRQGAEKFVRHWLNALAYTPLMIPFHKRVMVEGIERFVRGRAGPHLIHSFYTWGCVGLDLRCRLGAAHPVRVINSVYTTAEDEMRAKFEGLRADARLIERLLYAAEFGWVKTVVTRYERRAYCECDLVTANYESVRQRFLASYGRGAEFRLLPYTSDVVDFRDATRDVPETPPEIAASAGSNAPVIVSLSRHDPRKGIDVFLRALARVRDAGAAFHACLLSGGPLFDSHRRLASELGLDDFVTFTGWIEDPHPYLRRADLFVLPSTQEGSGSLALIEALHAGLAVVASDVDGIPEDVTHEESGLLVKPGDVEGFANIIIRALKDSDLRRRLGDNARKTFAERFSPDAFAAALGEVYRMYLCR
ncbi:MAG: glycosyltransferase family 4 protein [Acidobacteria bacterium]|nr:glycosyltransferase family 4 protein [Acidobacteriota bacterium]